MATPQTPDERARLQRLERLERRQVSLQAELDSLRLSAVGWPAAAAAFLAVVLPLWAQVEPDPLDSGAVAPGGPDSLSLVGLLGQASDFSNGAVTAFSAITLAALVVLGIAAVSAVVSGGWKRVLIPSGVAAFAWLCLFVAVASSGGEGAVGELGYENTARILAIPLAVVLGAATAFTAHDLRR